jgi:hypothetical protein
MFKKYYIIALWIWLYPMEAQLSENVDYVDIESVVQKSPLIVIAKPKGIAEIHTIKFRDDSSYKWSTQDFEIIEVLKKPNGDKVGQIIIFSTFDDYVFDITKKYADGISKVGWYRTYRSYLQDLVEENDKRIMFLKKLPNKDGITNYAYIVNNSFDAIESLENVKKIITTK